MITLLDPKIEGLVPNFGLLKDAPLDVSKIMLNNIREIDYAGENVFVAFNDTTAVFFKCLPDANKIDGYNCIDLQLSLNLSENRERFQRAQVLNGILVTVTSQYPSQLRKMSLGQVAPLLNTTITARSIEDG